jgi:hypothetical protein
MQNLLPPNDSFTLDALHFHLCSLVTQYRRPRYVMGLWGAGVFSYVSYVWGGEPEDRWSDISCGDGYGCKIAKGLLKWLEVLIHLSTMGLLFIFLSSFGNSIFAGRDLRSVLSVGVAIAAVIVFIVLPFFVVSFLNASLFVVASGIDWVSPLLWYTVDGNPIL